MRTHHATLSVGLLVAATACGDILGIDDDNKLVECNTDDNCTNRAKPSCNAHKCVALGGTSGNAGTSHGGSGGLFATSGGTAGSGGSGIVPVSGGTGGVSITTGGLAGTTASEGGTESIGGTGGIVASGGTQSVGGESGTAGSTTFVGGGGGIAGYGGTVPFAGTGATSVATSGAAGMTQGGAGGHVVSGGTAGIGAAGAGAIGNNGGVSGGGTGGVAGIGGTGAVAGVGGSGGCTPGTHRCYPQEPGDFADYEDEVRIVGHPVSLQTCDSQGKWDVGVVCLGYCSVKKGKCEDGTSCDGLNRCNGNRSCCNSLPLPSSTNTFNRSREGDSCPEGSLCPAKVSAFVLDTFEVTVGRFRNFVSQFPSNIPKTGDGRNPRNSADPGWSDAWKSLIPSTQSELTQNLVGCTGTTYSAQSEGHDFEPINCVNWYLAFAFCIWDGGRLPTEAEWIYAASGGKDRLYPWSIPPQNPLIEPADDYAIFNYNYTYKWTRPQPVGSTTKGKARWGQHDLAGNVFEWVADAYAITYPDPESCVDCANCNWLTEVRRVVHGGAFDYDESVLTPTYRMSTLASEVSQRYGFRCARNP